MRAAPLLLLAGACTYQESRFETTLPAEGVSDVFCDLEAGSFVYAGTAGDGTAGDGTAEDPGEFTVGVASWAEASSGGRADKRIANNEWGAQVSGGLLDLWGRSPLRRSGVDLAVIGPAQVNVEAVLLDGEVELYDVDGSHLVTANGIVGSGIHGDVDLYASLTGINVQVFPRDDSTLRFEGAGDVWIELPFGLDYDLEVFADPDWGVEVQDLGFDDLFVAPDYVSGLTGDGSIQVEVFVSGGTFHLWQAAEPMVVETTEDDG